MKLYYSPGACSLSPHIILEEAGLKYEAEKVDLKTKKTETGADFTAVNPKGMVPTLKLDDGTVLTEGPAIVQYIADQAPGKHLLAASGNPARYRAVEWLNFVSTELHKQFTPLFRPDTPEDYKKIAAGNVAKAFAFADQSLQKSRYLVGDEFSVADAYLFTVSRWAPLVKIDLSPYSALKTYQERVAERPAVQATMKAEGLVKQK